MARGPLSEKQLEALDDGRRASWKGAYARLVAAKNLEKGRTRVVCLEREQRKKAKREGLIPLDLAAAGAETVEQRRALLVRVDMLAAVVADESVSLEDRMAAGEQLARAMFWEA